MRYNILIQHSDGTGSNHRGLSIEDASDLIRRETKGLFNHEIMTVKVEREDIEGAD